MTTTGLSCLFRTGLGQFLLLSAQSAPAQNIARYGTCIRSGPSRQARVMLVVPGGYPIEVLEQSDGWTRFRDWQNSTARVASPLVSDIDTAVILASRGQIRSDAGVIRTVLAKKNGWGQRGLYETDSPAGWTRHAPCSAPEERRVPTFLSAAGDWPLNTAGGPMPIDTFLKSLPEDSTRHVQPDIEFLAVAPCPFLEDDQVGYQIERLSGHLGTLPDTIRRAAIGYSLYVRQLDVIQEQEATIRTLCADQCDRPPVGCCTGEHHVLLSLADILISQPTQDALHLAHVLTGLQRREHDNALGQGMIPAPGPCHCLTESGCSLRLFKSPRCLHYLCPQVQRALIAVHGDSVVGFLEAMHETCNTVIRGLDDFTSGQVIAAAETLFPH